MMWTQFHDMNSGGGRKEEWGHIFIEAPRDEACVIFYNRFGHNPERVTCTCCGEDYSLTESESLEQATAYERGCRWVEDERGWLLGKERPADYREGRYLEPGEPVPTGYRARENYRGGDGVTLDQYLASGNALVIRASDIKPEERVGEVPEQGYVWHD